MKENDREKTFVDSLSSYMHLVVSAGVIVKLKRSRVPHLYREPAWNPETISSFARKAGFCRELPTTNPVGAFCTQLAG